jgi:hypothetical protein
VNRILRHFTNLAHANLPQCAILILLVRSDAGFANQIAPTAQARGTVAFVNVNLVPMDSEKVLPHQTVIVHNRKIVRIGSSATTSVPKRAQRIEGGGKFYLMPGLADMHVHAFEQDDLTLYVANGVTTILTLGGTPESFVRDTRGRITSGKEIGPTPYVGFLVDGCPPIEPWFFCVKGEKEARSAVIDLKRRGYDFIKVYNNLGRQEFYAITSEARQQNIAVVGHAVRSIELKDALNAGQVMVAHGEEYIYMYFHDSRDPLTALTAAQFTRDSGAYVIPNLSTYEAISIQWGKPEQVRAFFARPEAKYLNPCRKEWWARSDYVRRSGALDGNLLFLRLFTKTLNDAGVPLMLGTDSPNIPRMFPGYSIHDDLRNMVESGLSPYQALSAGTRIPGLFIKKFVPNTESFGTVSVGSRADLLLLKNNPLESVRAVQEPIGVMAAGHWMSRASLHSRLEGYAKQYRANACGK